MNKRRGVAGLSTLETVTIPLLEDDDEEEGALRQSVTKEEKISSSGRRFEALGTLLRPPRQKVCNSLSVCRSVRLFAKS